MYVWHLFGLIFQTHTFFCPDFKDSGRYAEAVIAAGHLQELTGTDFFYSIGTMFSGLKLKPAS